MNRKMKILFIAPGPKYNLEHAFKRRCELLSLYFKGEILTSGPVDSESNYGNFVVKSFEDEKGKSLKTYIRIFLWAMRGAWLGKKARKKYDIVISYDPLKTGLVAVFIGWFLKSKVIVEVNGCYDNEWIYANAGNCLKRSLKRWIFTALESFSLKNSDGIKLLFDTQIDNFLPVGAKIAHFEDYVDSGEFRDIESRKEVLLVGFPFLIKGVDVLLQAWRTVYQDFPDWSLKILGYYPDKSEFQGFLGNNMRVELHDAVDPSMMPEHIGRCSVLVLPSRTEAMGRVLIEAMASGKARIGSDVGGIPTVIRDEVDGLLVPAEDVLALADALRRVLSDDELRRRLGTAARQRYEKDFPETAYLERLRAFYEVVASN